MNSSVDHPSRLPALFSTLTILENVLQDLLRCCCSRCWCSRCSFQVCFSPPRISFLFRVNAYPLALVNAAPRTNSAATKSRALKTPKLLRLLRALVSQSTLTFLSVSLATPSLSSVLLATNGKWRRYLTSVHVLTILLQRAEACVLQQV